MKRIGTMLMLLAVAGSALAGEPAPKRPQRPIALDEVVRLALERNILLAAEKINPKRADTVVVEQMSIFDPTAYSQLSRARTKERPRTGALGGEQDAAQSVLGVAKLFPLGTTVDVHAGAAREWSDSQVTEIDPSYDEEWGFTLTQPLLRGLGVLVNTAGIATARNERRIAQAQLRDVALKTVSDAKQVYWELVFSIRNRELLQRSLERAENLQREVQARVEAGVLGERDPSVAQARAEVAIRQEDIVVAEDAIHDTEEALKVITDLAADPKIWDVAFIPTTQPPEELPIPAVDQAVETGLARRPDYQAARIAIENQDLQLLVRRNELLPRLDFQLSGGHTGRGTSWNAADHYMGTMDYYNWAIGLNFEYPLGNRAAKSRLRRAQLERRQIVLNLRAFERQIQLEVRNGVRQQATNAGRLRAADASVAAEEERLRAEEIRFREARVGTGQDVLDAQAALAEAERRRLRALIDLNVSAVERERLQGTLLETSNVVFEED